MTPAHWTIRARLTFWYLAVLVPATLLLAFGSWLLMPVSCAQLFHAFVFDRENTPKVCLE